MHFWTYSKLNWVCGEGISHFPHFPCVLTLCSITFWINPMRAGEKKKKKKLNQDKNFFIPIFTLPPIPPQPGMYICVLSPYTTIQWTHARASESRRERYREGARQGSGCAVVSRHCPPASTSPLRFCTRTDPASIRLIASLALQNGIPTHKCLKLIFHHIQNLARKKKKKKPKERQRKNARQIRIWKIKQMKKKKTQDDEKIPPSRVGYFKLLTNHSCYTLIFWLWGTLARYLKKHWN